MEIFNKTSFEKECEIVFQEFLGSSFCTCNPYLLSDLEVQNEINARSFKIPYSDACYLKNAERFCSLHIFREMFDDLYQYTTKYKLVGFNTNGSQLMWSIKESSFRIKSQLDNGFNGISQIADSRFNYEYVSCIQGINELLNLKGDLFLLEYYIPCVDPYGKSRPCFKLLLVPQKDKYDFFRRHILLSRKIVISHLLAHPGIAVPGSLKTVEKVRITYDVFIRKYQDLFRKLLLEVTEQLTLHK